MRALSNNHQDSLPFTDIQIHMNKFSDDDTGYDSITNSVEEQKRIRSTAGLSASSSLSMGRYHTIMNLVDNIPSPTDISTTNGTSDIVLTIAERIAKLSNKSEPMKVLLPVRKTNRTRIKPPLDTTSDSADSCALKAHVASDSLCRKQIPQVSTVSSIDTPQFGGNLKHIHDNRFDSITTVDHVKNDVVELELMEHKQNHALDIHFNNNKQQPMWLNRLGESIRLLPANVIAVVFIGLIGGLFISAIFVVIIA